MRGRTFLAVAGFVLCAAGTAAAAEGYYSQPDVHRGRIVFTAEGDIWATSAAGGPSHRLTSHPGREYFPRFSPDGNWIAFTAQYDGNPDVFVMPAGGGEPRRLTWHPSPDEVLGWTPDGTYVLFRSRRDHPHGSLELYRVPVAGGDAEPLGIGWAARLEIDPETGLWAFSRLSRETRTWKRYRGGTAPNIWVGDPERNDFQKVTDFDGNDAFPMWYGGRIYYLSDRGGTANIWSMLPNGSDLRRHTEEDTWDIRWPAMGPGGEIVYQLGADIHLLDLRSGRSRHIRIELPSDRVLTRTRYPNPQQYITHWDLSADGERLLVTARGELYSVPVKKGVTLRLTDGTGARERRASYAPDGKSLVYISDEVGEEDIRSLDAWGRGEEKVLKEAGESGWHFPPVYSPDGKWIAFSDDSLTLYVLPGDGGAPLAVDRSEEWEITDYSWSPDGRWLAYSKVEPGDFRSIWIFDTKKRESHRVTDNSTDDHSPCWDPKGRYLYFLSNRTMNPFIGWRDFETIQLKTTKPYMVLLKQGAENPLADTKGLPGGGDGEDGKKGSDKKGRKGKKEKDDDEGDDKPAPVEITIEGLADRVVELPVSAGQFFGLVASEGKVFYLSVPSRGMAEEPEWWEEETPGNDLIAFDLESKKAETFLDGVTGYSITPKGDKLAVAKGRGEIYVVDTGGKPSDLSESKVDLSGMVLELDPRAEWRQIYYEAWRLMRDFHWDEGMSGLDWKAIRDQYAALLPRLSTRQDLRDLLGELIGELATSHTYVWGGDAGVNVGGVSTGLLGAEVEREGDVYRVARIYRGGSADNERSPLDEPDVNVKVGDYIRSVNNKPFATDRPFEAAFANLAGKRVALEVSDRASGGKTRSVVVTPMGNDNSLIYADWVRQNREYVTEQTDGQMGYIHIPDMGTSGMVEFDTWFYPQLKKKGMVVDVRWNGGGFVSQLILERLRRRVLSFDRAASGGISTYPYRTLNGPFVVLTNQFAGSDGDIFPMAVQLEGLAPVIGMRSWGGVVGIRADKPLVDRGMLTQPEFAWWDPKQGWSLENRGVIPDIQVENHPQDLAAGKDPQLDRGIAEVLKLREQGSWPSPDFGPEPDKSRDAFHNE